MRHDPIKPGLEIYCRECRITVLDQPVDDAMQIFLLLLVGFVLFLSGCADRPELVPNAYGIILEALPEIEEADEPFLFPREDGNDHQNCVFKEEDFM